VRAARRREVRAETPLFRFSRDGTGFHPAPLSIASCLHGEIFDGLRRLVPHDDRAGGGGHATDAVADRDPGAGDLGGSGTTHLAHAGMHVGEIAAIGVERQLEPGAVLRSPMKPLASSRGTKPSPLTQ
jgi:hypothetical protein